ncbi:MAG: hypothetical protein Q8K26_04460, partial [Candidatus Gracilibacteria bacterium]|nr:hypothetical protein [Candidatus Gracilibacteria bacterium]
IDKIMMELGFQLFHLGAVKMGEKTILVAGDKGAGKTTTIVMALEQLGAQYIANDRVWGKVMENGLMIIEREADTKIGEKTIIDSTILSKTEDPLLDEESGKYFFNRLYSFFGSDKRTISGISDRILLPQIQSSEDGIVTESYRTDDILTQSLIEDCQGFNIYRALYGNPVFRTKQKLDCILKYSLNGFGPNGIINGLKLLSKN